MTHYSRLSKIVIDVPPQAHHAELAFWQAVTGEQLVLVVHPETPPPIPQEIVEKLAEHNRRLLPYKRVGGYLVWNTDFPRTASMKVKRAELAEQIRKAVGRDAVVPL